MNYTEHPSELMSLNWLRENTMSQSQIMMLKLLIKFLKEACEYLSWDIKTIVKFKNLYFKNKIFVLKKYPNQA